MDARRVQRTLAAGGLVLGLAASAAAGADAPSVEQVFKFKPRQPGVEIETPEPADFAKCQVKVERQGKVSGWAVYGPAGQLVRRFVDSNGDNTVDQWRYFRHGLEVYRDLDTDGNNKMDQFRWFNTAGSRWGIDANEDGRIDRWKVISPEEVSREVVQALVKGDEAALQPLLLTADDAKTLGLSAELSKTILSGLADPAGKLKDVTSESKILTPETRWMRFDSSSPGVIPADESKASQDLYVYENAMAIIDAAGETALLQLGEMVRVGDAWKLTQFPRPIEGNSIQVSLGGPLMEPDFTATVVQGELPVPGGFSMEVQKLLEDLRKLDEAAPSPDDELKELARYNAARAEILGQLVKLAERGEEREMWQRQRVDGITAAVQTGAYPDGLEQLKAIEAEVRAADEKSPMVPYVAFRRLLAEYSSELQKSDADAERRQELQKWWLAELEKFAADWPNAEDTAEVLLQLAITQEFAGKVEQARTWYEQLVKSHPNTAPGERAVGAVRRLDLDGKEFRFAASGLDSGQIDARQFRGKVLLVIFWSTWCKPCTEDLPQVRELYKQFQKDGFEILGVNLDTDLSAVQPFMRQHQMVWPQAYEPGGLDSPPAKAFGIISLPTMFLVDAEGKVVSRSTSVADLKTQLPDLLRK